MYTAYKLNAESKEMLKRVLKPAYSKFIGDHITVEFGVPANTPLPKNGRIHAVCGVDSKDGLQAIVVTVDGRYNRPDGKIYHITWSLDPDKYKPVDSNALIERDDTRGLLITRFSPVSLNVTPVLQK